MRPSRSTAKRWSTAPSGTRTRYSPSTVSLAGLKKTWSTSVIARSRSTDTRTSRRRITRGHRAWPSSPGTRASRAPTPAGPSPPSGPGRARPPVQSRHNVAGVVATSSANRSRSPASAIPGGRRATSSPRRAPRRSRGRPRRPRRTRRRRPAASRPRWTPGRSPRRRPPRTRAFEQGHRGAARDLEGRSRGRGAGCGPESRTTRVSPSASVLTVSPCAARATVPAWASPRVVPPRTTNTDATVVSMRAASPPHAQEEEGEREPRRLRYRQSSQSRPHRRARSDRAGPVPPWTRPPTRAESTAAGVAPGARSRSLFACPSSSPTGPCNGGPGLPAPRVLA